MCVCVCVCVGGGGGCSHVFAIGKVDCYLDYV